MATKFEADIQQTERLTHIKVLGTLDEDNELLPLAGHIRGEATVIDLSGISEINNCGVRDWVHWLGEVQGRATAVVLVECSPAIVAQLNQVSNFAGKAYVKSFYVPYFCQACDKEKAILVDMDEFKQGKVGPPTCRCDSCDGVMTFDDLEESYFAFVKDVRRKIPDKLLEMVDGLAPAGGERKFLARADITGTFTHVPSTAGGRYVSGYRSFAGSTSIPSAGALRRLRHKSGLRTHQLGVSNDEEHPRSRRKLILFSAVGLVVGLAVVGAILTTC